MLIDVQRSTEGSHGGCCGKSNEISGQYLPKNNRRPYLEPERDYYQTGEQQQICKDDTEQDRLPYRSEHTEAIFPYKRGKRAETGSKTSLFKEELISALRTTCPEAFQKTLWKLYPP